MNKNNNFPYLGKMFSVDEMSYLWNVQSMKNVLSRWNVLSMKGSIYEMSFYEKCSQSMKCIIYERFYLWNVPSMKNVLSRWNVLSMNSLSPKCLNQNESFLSTEKQR